MANCDYNRVVYYSPNAFCLYYVEEKVVEIVSSWTEGDIVDINDAIEFYQCKLMLDNCPSFPDKDELNRLRALIKPAFSESCSATNKCVSSYSLLNLFESVEYQYQDAFWGMIAVSGAAQRISSDELANLLNYYPEELCSILKHPVIVEKHADVLKDSMVSHPEVSAELIIDGFAIESDNRKSLSLPASMNSDDLDTIMLNYLSTETPNLNYVRVLAIWPESSSLNYKPSRKVLVTASKKATALNDALLANSKGISFSTSVIFDRNQKACKRESNINGERVLSFGSEWLLSHVDSPTILNNYIYVFDFIDSMGLLTMPANKRKETAFARSLKVRALREYPTSFEFDYQSNKYLMVTFAYMKLLIEQGTRLEDSLEWFYNQYIEEEFDIRGFSISLPAPGTTWLDKCKSLGPEIERVLKAFILIVRDGEIDESYFPYISISDFQTIPSKIKNKYYVDGPEFDRYAQLLMSDQSCLAHSKMHKRNNPDFFSMMLENTVLRRDFLDIYQNQIDWLLDNGLITCADSGVLSPSKMAFLLACVWRKGALVRHCLSKEEKMVADELVKLNCFEPRSSLFAPIEADYLNYMFNNAKFSNSIALRNKYDHGSGRIDDPNSQIYEEDYVRLLNLLIAITLKINDELMIVTGRGGMEDFVEWPLTS